MSVFDLVLGKATKLLLTFHAVDDTWADPGLSVPAAFFSAVVAQLAAAGYRGETFSAVSAARPGERLVAITFDDAFSSVATVAAPILHGHGWPGTVFVPTASLGDWMHWIGPDTRRRHPTATRQLEPGQLCDLAGKGWEIGSHSHTHRLLSRLDRSELEHGELALSRDILRSLVGRCDVISYPWGEVNTRVVEASRRTGYTIGSGLSGRFTWNDPLNIPRIAISGCDGPFRYAIKVSALHWRLRASAAWTMIEAGRGMSGDRDTAPLPWRRRASSILRRGERSRTTAGG